MTDPRIRSFSYHYRHKFGTPVGKIPLDLGHICPNRHHGGCIFCAAPAFTPGYLKKQENIQAQITKGKKDFLQKRFKKYFAYFQQETATVEPVDRLFALLPMVLNDPDCVGLILSTDPTTFPGDSWTPLPHMLERPERIVLSRLACRPYIDEVWCCLTAITTMLIFSRPVDGSVHILNLK